MGTCHFFEVNTKSKLTAKRKLGQFITQQIHRETGMESFLSYNFVDDDTLLQMNIEYLQHDTYTDIITFDLSPQSPKIKTHIEADIYISIDRVLENATLHQSTYLDELHRVIMHGALHLIGYKDKTTKEKHQMRSKEEEWLERYKNTH